jgi:hypothetical protein
MMEMFWLCLSESRYHLQIIDETLGACHYSWDPFEKPDNSPLYTVAGNILLNTSVTATESKREKGPLCLWLRELLKKLEGILLVKTEHRRATMS